MNRGVGCAVHNACVCVCVCVHDSLSLGSCLKLCTYVCVVCVNFLEFQFTQSKLSQSVILP